MSSIDKLTKEALALPTEQKVQLVDYLIENLAANDNEEVSSAWLNEVTRRKAEIIDGSVELIPGDEALEIVRRIL